MTYDRVSEPTLASTWHAASSGAITDELLDWPPDVFALTNVVLARSEAFRFALSPVGEWPPRAIPTGSKIWPRGSTGVCAWRCSLCTRWPTRRAPGSESRLTLPRGGVCLPRAGRELLVRNGSMARVDPRLLRVLPKVCTPPTGRPAFSRYACVRGPGIEACWHKMPTRHRGTDLRSEYATLLLLPWPLEVSASDFRPIEGSVQRPSKDPFGFFEFAPAQASTSTSWTACWYRAVGRRRSARLRRLLA
jgi:hypothetical protein